jgi:flagellar hook-associated protein 2
MPAQESNTRMGITPLGFTGASQYSSDFQQILTRAVQIASIPVKQLQNRDADLLQQKTLLGSLRSAVADLASSLSSLGSIAANQAITASTSDPSVLTVTSTAASAPAAYTINSVTSIASPASERTITGYADSSSTPVSSTGTVALTVGTQTHTINLTNNSLIGLRDQINSLAAGVTASILTTPGGNYLSVTANSAGQTTLKLVDDPTGAATDLLTNTNQGTNAQFQLNGIGVVQPSNLVNSVIPGVTFQLLSTTNSPVNITLSTDRSKLSQALGDFADKYNALSSQLKAQTGKSAGLLTGNTVITGLQRILRSLNSYRTDTGSITDLAGLGLRFDPDGKLTFSQSVFDALSDSALSGGFRFIGSATTGLGGFSKTLSEYSDPFTGLIRNEQDGIDRTDQSLQKQIDTMIGRINEMQTRLYERLALADAVASQLEAQQKALDASLQGLSLVLYGKKDR